jgi:hypothetical protein
MSSISLLRIAARAQPITFFRANGLRSMTPRTSNALYVVPALIATSGSVNSFSTSNRKLSDEAAGHHEESFEEFTARYDTFNWSRRVGLGVLLHCRDAIPQDQHGLIIYENIDTRRNSSRCRMSSNFRYYFFTIQGRL